MSGIVGIVQDDGAQVSRDLVWRLTRSMAYRGPDAQEIYVDGSVGLGHALMRTGGDSHYKRQPLTLDGRVWITADARIDGRNELMAALQVRQSGENAGLSDEELILRAYG